MQNNELINALRCEKDCKDCSYWQDNAWSHCDEWGMRCDAADAIERLEAEVPRWIPVTERMPPDSGDVLIYSASHLVGVGCYLPNRFVGQKGHWVQWYSGGGIGVSVTHWMPLPKAPDLT